MDDNTNNTVVIHWPQTCQAYSCSSVYCCSYTVHCLC